MDDKLSTKTAKIMSLENLYIYGMYFNCSLWGGNYHFIVHSWMKCTELL